MLEKTLESPLDTKEIKPSLRAQLVKNPPAMQETLVQFLGQEDPLEKLPLQYCCLGNPMDRILEWVAISSFRGSSQPRDCASFQIKFLSGGH